MTPQEQFARFRRSRREAAVIAAIFVAVFALVVGAAAPSGFRDDDCIRAPESGFLGTLPTDRIGGRPLRLSLIPTPNGSPASAGYVVEIPDGYRPTIVHGPRDFLAGPGVYVHKGQVLARPIAEPHPTTLLGLPSWVVLCVLAPWLACIGITFWFGSAYMKDESTADAALDPPDAEARRAPAYRVEPTHAGPVEPPEAGR